MMRSTIKAAVLTAAVLFAITPAATAATPRATNLTDSFRAAAAGVEQLQVYEISGIVVIRGRTTDKAQAEQLNQYAQSLGYARVANLIQTVKNTDDAALTRKAEVELSLHRALDGCQFTVSSDNGNVTVAGRVRHELQKDVAVQVLRGIDGVRSVELSLAKF